ncbi:MAG TPA: hypothetical protein PLF73_07935 [Luteimonas sp.]|nr:hypothetical protein [Luteimonas sp.]
MSWDPLQREILAELGHVVYAVGGRGAAPAAMSGSAVPVDASAAGPDPLLHALLRAAGRDAGDAEALALCRGLLPPGGLRDVASRRALWPRLRALRARPPR